MNIITTIAGTIAITIQVYVEGAVVFVLNGDTIVVYWLITRPSILKLKFGKYFTYGGVDSVPKIR